MRGIAVDHATIQRWVFKFVPLIELELKKTKNSRRTGWKMNKTYVKVKGIWCY
ncbi:hypothetical protein ACFFLS_05390 [Flavobacterium procerum]|uniref:IS6 family transposase n=1 Tax=Flavobacterium procerum TaxID=1455569 RepID=A0ABV6BM00_9FLAO